MSSHHTQGSVCLLCDEKMTQAHPVLAYWYRVVKVAFLNTHCAWTWRGQKDQDQFYKEGKSRVMFPKSAHNATLDGEPCSRAMDLFFIRPDGVASWDVDMFQKVADYLKQMKAPIEWGGDWKGGFSDKPHFQLAKEVAQNDHGVLPET